MKANSRFLTKEEDTFGEGVRAYYQDGRSSFSEQSLFYWKGQSLLTTLKPNIFLLCIAVSLFSSGFTSLFKFNAKIAIYYTFQSYCPQQMRLSLHNYDFWSILCIPWRPIHDFWWKKKTLLTKENAVNVKGFVGSQSCKFAKILIRSRASEQAGNIAH